MPLMYHAAAIRCRQSIRAHGLDYRRSRARPTLPRWPDGTMRPMGNYLYADLHSALCFADRHIAGAFEIWAVDTASVPLLRDPEPCDHSAWYCTGPIPPHALRRIVWSHDPAAEGI